MESAWKNRTVLPKHAILNVLRLNWIISKISEICMSLLPKKTSFCRQSPCISPYLLSSWIMIADPLTCCSYWSTGWWCYRGQAKRCWTNRSDWETSHHPRTKGSGNQNIRASRPQRDVDSKLIATIALIIRCDQILRRIGWINRMIVKTAISVHWPVAYKSVCATRGDCHPDRLIIV